MKKIINTVVLTLLAITLAACDSKSIDSGATAFISKGPVTGAICNIYKVTNGAQGAASIATATSSAGTVDFGSLTYIGAALISCTGGAYTDEATGNTLNAPVMNSVVTVSTGGHYVMSPLTELAFRLAGANLQTAIDTHNAAVATQFGLDDIDITSEQPTDLNTTAAGNDNAGKYGSVLAGISQLQKDGTEGANLSIVLNSLEADLADVDGELDTATQNNMANALVDLASSGSVAGGNFNSDVTDDIVANVLVAPSIDNIVSQSFDYNSAISTLSFNNTGGGVLTSCSASQNMPAGLSVDVSSDNLTCEITGIPTVANPAATFNITATNIKGSDTANVNITINALDITVTANSGQNKVYGSADPSLAYSITTGVLEAGDSLSGVLGRSSGENVGNSYGITSGSLANTNYNITYVADTFSITAKPITVTAVSGQAKVYGTSDPAFSYTISTSSLETGDSLSGSLGRAAGESVGSSYGITIGSLANTNYGITYVAADFAITTKPITVTAASGQSKVYGANDPALSYTIPLGSLETGDSLSGSLIRAAGENVGSSYGITIGSLANTNYGISYVAADFAITTKPITVTANSGQAKVYGTSDPTFSYTISTSSLETGDSLSGSLVRTAGENVGSSYGITIGNLDNANYGITFVAANFEIIKANMPNISIVDIVRNPTNNTDFEPTATGGHGAGTIIATSSSLPSVATIVNNQVHIVGVGTTTITAHEQGDANYNDSADTTFNLIVNLAPTNLVGTVGDTEAILDWNIVAGAADYNVYLATETFNGDVSNYASLANGQMIPNIGTNTATIPTLTNGVEFFFVTTSTANGVESAVSNEVTVTPEVSQRDQWLNNASTAISEKSANLYSINGGYSSQSYGQSGVRLTEDKYAVGHYNTSDTNSDSKLFIYNPQTKTSLVEINAGGITRPQTLMDINGNPVIHNDKAIIVSGHPFGQQYGGPSSRKIGLLDIASNTIVTSTIPSANLSNGVNYAMGDKGFVDGNTVYMTMHYKDYVAAPGVWIVKWDVVTNTFSHLNLTAAVNTFGLNGAFDDRAQFVAKGKTGHILIGLYASNVLHILEINEATGQVSNSVNVNSQTSRSGYYEAINYKGHLFAVPISEVGSGAEDMKILKINIANFTHQLIAIDEGTAMNTKRRENSYSSGFSQIPDGETGLFVPRNSVIYGSDSANQHVMMLDLETPRFYFISLDVNNFQPSLSDSTNDILIFTGMSAQKNGQIIAATFWRDVSQSCSNNTCHRHGTGIYHAKGKEIIDGETSGEIVDPYIIGATLFEDFNDNGIHDNGELISSASDAQGGFTFSAPLTIGKTIRIHGQGTHEGKTYDLNLEATVVDDNGAGIVDVVTPMTTFDSKGLTNQNLANMLNTAAGTESITIGGSAWSITANDVGGNPLDGDLLNATLNDIQTNEALLKKLQASLATYGILKVMNSTTALQTMDAAALIALQTLTDSMLKGVSDSLNQTLLTNVESQLNILRGELTNANVQNVNTVAPEVNADLISKVAVSIIDRTAELAAIGAASDVSGIAANEVNSALSQNAALGTFIAYINASQQAVFMELAIKLYGMKHATTLAPIEQFLAAGNTPEGYLKAGILAAQSNKVTYRFDGSNILVAE